MRLCEAVHQWIIGQDLLGPDIAIAHRCKMDMSCPVYAIWQDISKIVATVRHDGMMLYDGHSYTFCAAGDPDLFQKFEESIKLIVPSIVPDDLSIEALKELYKRRAKIEEFGK